MSESTLTEPAVIELSAWPELPPPIFNYACRVAKYFTGQPISVGIEVLAGQPATYRVWLSMTRSGQRFYKVQLDTTPEQAEARGP